MVEGGGGMFLNVWGVEGGLFFLREEMVLLYLDVYNHSRTGQVEGGYIK